MRCVPACLVVWALASASPAAVAAKFEPAPCERPADKLECGWLVVPERFAQPDGKTLRLWVAIARATGPQAERQPDPLVYINGGPGVETVARWTPAPPKELAPHWDRLRRQRDIVYLDQRATGRSEPSFCRALDEDIEALAREAPDAQAYETRFLALVERCRGLLATEGVDPTAYTAVEAAHDLESLRTALGYRQLSLYGVSWGTTVALNYLREHPGRARAVILDSVFPTNSAFWAEQATSLGMAFEELQRECQRDEACAAALPPLLPAFAEARRRLDAQPVPIEGGRITGDSFAEAVWYGATRDWAIPYLPLAIEQARLGNNEGVERFVALMDFQSGVGRYNSWLGLATACHDVLAGGTTAGMRAAAARYPWLVGADHDPTRVDRYCAAVNVGRAPAAYFAPVESDAPVLVYAGQFDAATPPQDALQAIRFLPRATLVNVAGGSHASFYTDECTLDIGVAFLADPSTPPSLDCLGKRPAFRVATDGFEAFLERREAAKARRQRELAGEG